MGDLNNHRIPNISTEELLKMKKVFYNSLKEDTKRLYKTMKYIEWIEWEIAQRKKVVRGKRKWNILEEQK